MTAAATARLETKAFSGVAATGTGITHSSDGKLPAQEG